MSARDYVIEKTNELIKSEGSLRKAAKALGIDVTYLSRIRNGKLEPCERFMNKHFPDEPWRNNGDCFRQATNKQLAAFFATLDECPSTKIERPCNINCYECWLRWFNAPGAGLAINMKYYEEHYE